MVRLTSELIDDSKQYINAVNDRELNLRGCKIPAIENLGGTRNQFDTIDFTDNDIRKLDNLPTLSRLRSLLFHNNRIQQIQPTIGNALPGLTMLILTNNNICELGDLEPLASLPKLEYLSLIGNPVVHKPQYRLFVIFKMPQVRVLDFKRVRLAERTAAKSMFKGSRGKALRKEVVKKSRLIEADEPQPVQTATLPPEDALRIKEAIASAKSLREVEQLQQMLQSGHIPGKSAAGNGAAPTGDDEAEMETEH